MKKQYALAVFLGAVLIVAVAAIAGSGRSASDLPAPPAIGTMIDDFTLPDADGASHSLASLKGKNGTVVIFIATKCPVSNAYNDRMEKVFEDYQAKGVNVVGINANSTEPAAEVKAHAAEKGLKFTILKDDGNKIADRLGASATPEAYLLDAKGKLVYHGRIDNSRDPAGIASSDLRDALNEVLAGKPVTKTEAKAFGCTIKRV